MKNVNYLYRNRELWTEVFVELDSASCEPRPLRNRRSERCWTRWDRATLLRCPTSPSKSNPRKTPTKISDIIFNKNHLHQLNSLIANCIFWTGKFSTTDSAYWEIGLADWLHRGECRISPTNCSEPFWPMSVKRDCRRFPIPEERSLLSLSANEDIVFG